MSYARRNLSKSGNIHGADNPFAQGTFRWVAKGVYTSGPRKGEPCVAKWFKSGATYESTFYAKDIHAVERAQRIIDDFNRAGIVTNRILLNHPEVWVFTPDSGTWAGQKHLVEPYIEDYEKWNSNSGAIFGSTGWHQVMQALSHFSYHASSGQFVLCDLQGGLYPDGTLVLTDPVILSQQRTYGVTDLGPAGITTFFARHQCSSYCRDHWTRPRDRSVHYMLAAGTTMAGFE